MSGKGVQVSAMKARAIRTLDELHIAINLLTSATPSWFERTERASGYLRRFAAERPLHVILEDATGMVGVALATLDKETAVLADVFVTPNVDSCSTRALLIQAVSEGAEALDATCLAVPALWQLATIYEEIGFAATLFVQLYGDHREFWRQQLVREHLRDYRVLQLCSYGRDIAQAVFRLPQVDRDLLNQVERSIPACQGGSLFMMNRWVGPGHDVRQDGFVTYRRPQYVVTHFPRFRKSAFSECLEVDPLSQHIAPSEASRMVVSAGTPGCDLAPAFKAKVPTFVQHLAPVRERIPLDGTVSDLQRLVLAVSDPSSLCTDRTFAVQCRKAGRTVGGSHVDAPYTAKDVEVHVGSHLEQKGFVVELEHPEQVVSIYLSGAYAFLGISNASDNISRHADEYRRRSAESPLVSRAQHKLEEALEAFEIAVLPGTRALDLGAAPGGWTKVLADSGATVVSVDPGALSPVLDGYSDVEHLRCRVEELDFPDDSFDLIVNDMSIDPSESAALMCSVAHCLNPGASAIMTIKLPSLNSQKHIDDAMDILNYAYEVLTVRHMFHNRQEVTAHVVRRKTVSTGWEEYIVLRGAAREDYDQ